MQKLGAIPKGNRFKFSFATEDTEYTETRFFEQVIFQMRCVNWAKTPLSVTEPPLPHYSALQQSE